MFTEKSERQPLPLTPIFNICLVCDNATSGLGPQVHEPQAVMNPTGYLKGKKSLYDMTSDMAFITQLSCSTRQRHTHMDGALPGTGYLANPKISKVIDSKNI